MNCELAFVLLAWFTMPTIGVVRTVEDVGLSKRHESAFVPVQSKVACLPEVNVLSALRQVSSATLQSEADQARETLVNESRRSPKCRKQMIAVIMGAMDRPNLTFTGDPTMYQLWRDGAELLGDLKATEALDLLISHLDLHAETFSSSMSHQPALRGLIKMGPVAIPKLDAVLSHNPDRNKRHYAVYCISAIGGPSAVRVLKRALHSESDPCVNRFIRVSIDSLHNKNYKLGGDNTKWFSAFMCNE